MKHIKLFENFDRYEFGEIDPNNLTEYASEIFKRREDMEMEDIDLLLALCKANHKDIFQYGYSEKDSLKYFFITMECGYYEKEYDIYALGDYCYALIHKNKYKYETKAINGWLLDDLEEVYWKFEELLNNEKDH